MKIVYIACESHLAQLFLPIATAFRNLFPNYENTLIDPSNILMKSRESSESPVDLFTHHGFKGQIIDNDDFSTLQDIELNYQAYLFYLRLFRQIKPSIIVVAHEMGYAFYAVQTAKMMEIPTYHVQHGIWGPLKFDNYYALPTKNNGKSVNKKSITKFALRQLKLHVSKIIKNQNQSIPEELIPLKDQLKDISESYPLNADRMAVYGPYYKRQLMDRRPQFGEEKIDMVGLLRGDNFVNNPVESYVKICKRYQLQKDRKLALYFYSPFQEFPNSYELTYHPNKALIDAINVLKSLHKDINVLVLLHPGYRYSYYKNEIIELIKKNELNRVYVNKTHDDHYSLYKHASIVIGVKSGALYEAMIANVPIVVQPYVLSRIYDPQHIEAGAVVPVFSHFHLKSQIKRALTDKEYQQRLFENQKMLCNDLFGPIDGKCGERTAGSILRMLESKREKSKKHEG